MGDRLRLAIGVMGNASSLLLFTAPILTFSRVIRKKSTEEFSCLPYIITLLSCLIYTWYGLPIVSYRWENFPIVTINGLGILLESSFIIIYFWFATAKSKASYSKAYLVITILDDYACGKYETILNIMRPQMKIAALLIPVILVFCITVVISAFVFHDHHYRKVFVGTVGLVAAVTMYGSPLVVVRQVIRTKSVEFMPFYLSLFSFISSSLWMIYGLLSHDMFLASPNIAAAPLGLLQLIVYCKYRKRGIMEEPNKWDIEKKEEKSKQLQLVTDNNTNDKS
ncbi:hypothetical protein JRO89_XS11G0213900 [Xanthoceras sorbifolium]|uniref:Bidirectional sugar transporter SWEET n=1 Tax=Xanthoceras sorbifolium TaxID=99658 RepID=A0ABQ8HGK7_9ROSI|nr:hypothetical protein JRO89_XS11G0213900 [Xanthoceras sorbifolium]